MVQVLAHLRVLAYRSCVGRVSHRGGRAVCSILMVAVCVCAQGAIQEIMDAQRSSSAGPTTSEYKDLIRQSLTTAGREHKRVHI